jgi:uncharacterized protein (TIGR02246 family)
MNRQEATALVQRQARAWAQANAEAIIADFAPDGVLIAPGGQWKGHDALREAIDSFFAASGDIRVNITRVLVDGNQGAVEWTWSETKKSTGKRHTVDDAIIFTVRDGKIASWREYFDTRQADHT